MGLDAHKERIETTTSNPGHALWTGLLRGRDAQLTARRLLADDMLTGWGIRTLSSHAPSYNPMSYHNGAVWPHDTALIALGMKRAGDDNAACEVASQILEAGLLFPGGRLPELWCGFARDRRHRSTPAQYPVWLQPASLGGGQRLHVAAGAARARGQRPGRRSRRRRHAPLAAQFAAVAASHSLHQHARGRAERLHSRSSARMTAWPWMSSTAPGFGSRRARFWSVAEHTSHSAQTPIPATWMQSNALALQASRFLARRSDARIVSGLRTLAEGAVALLHSENHDARTNGEYRVIDVLSERLRVVADVGANRGDWTAYVLQRCPEAQVYCFELAEPTRRVLRSRFGHQPNVKIADYGLSDQACEVVAKYYASNDKLTSVYDFPHPRSAAALSERMQRGDEAMATFGVDSIDFLKVDAEGADLAVLRGFERMLDRAAISVIQFEYGFACVLARAFLLDFYELLGARGYRLGRVQSTGVDFQPYRFESENFFGPNFLAVHESAPELIARLGRSPS